MTFQKLSIGQTFDFISGTPYDSFHDRCVKISARKYRSLSTGIEYRIGSSGAEVYHVE